MEGDVLAFAQVMSVIITSATVLIAVGLGARAIWIRSSRPKQRLPMVDEGRLERIENAVDAIAIEVERISEAQRFSAALLSDRLPVRSAELGQPGVAKRINTPH
jgi:hypothetical protein